MLRQIATKQWRIQDFPEEGTNPTVDAYLSLINVCNSSCRKFMFSQVSVILSTGGGEVYTP